MAISSANLNSSPSGASAQTVMSSISNRNTSFSVNLTQKIDANGPGAASLAKTANAGLSSAKQEVSGVRAGMVADIKTAQNEIMAATKAAGHDATDVFPQSTTPNSVAELGLGAAAGKGAGSMATLGKTFSAASTIETISADRSKSPEAAMAEIADVLRSASEPSLTDTFGHVAQADAAPEMQPATVDWKSFLEEHGDEGLAAVMAFDPDSYNPDLFPELAAVDQALEGIDRKMGEFSNTQAYAEQNTYAAEAVEAIGMDALTAQAANVNASPDSYNKYAQWDAAGPLAKMLMKPDTISDANNSFDREADLQNLVNNTMQNQPGIMGA